MTIQTYYGRLVGCPFNHKKQMLCVYGYEIVKLGFINSFTASISPQIISLGI